ncbi:MAG: SH3 domain-containing protein [Pseudomonadota bacterium]
MVERWVWAGVLVACVAVGPVALAMAADGRVSGLPVPRFVSIGVEVANMRVGPRQSYDVVAVYRRRGLPLKVVDEFDNWREVEDHEGDRGWMHGRLLSGRRTVMVYPEAMILRRGASDEAPAILLAEPTVIADLLRCEAKWCFVEIDGRRGWMPEESLWGILPSAE